MRSTRLLKLAAAIAFTAATSARADDVPVPINLQADLLYMIVGHDRNLAARAGGTVHTLVLTKSGDEGVRASARFRSAAAAKAAVAGLPHVVEVEQYTTPAALADACRTRHIAIVWLSPGFSGAEAAAIGHALAGVSVLTASASPAVVHKGIVLGFDLSAGRTRILADLTQAAKQHVAFGPDVLGLMAVSR